LNSKTIDRRRKSLGHRTGTPAVFQGRRRKPWLAAGIALGVALAATGTTYALWNASTILGGGTITAGNLALEVTRPPEYWDVSPDRTDATDHINGLASSPLGHQIDLAEWRMVPGDKIAITQQVKVNLEGDNLTAALSLSGLKQAGKLPINWSYEVTEVPWGDVLGKGTITNTSTDRIELAYMTAGPIGGEGKPDSNDKVFMLEYPGEVVLEVVIYAQFDSATANSNHKAASEALSNLQLELNQVRHTGANFTN